MHGYALTLSSGKYHQMKFYDCQTAPSPRRVRMFIAEKGLDIECVEVDLRNGEHLSEHFRIINPRCTVPVLQLENGHCLNDTMAICHYLESVYPEPNLMGLDGLEQALVMNWYERTVSDGFLAAGEAIRNQFKGFRNRALTGPSNHQQIPELVERGIKRLDWFLQQLDDQLSISPYVALDRFTLADIGAFVCIGFSSWLKLPVLEQWPNINRWHSEIEQRPSAAL